MVREWTPPSAARTTSVWRRCGKRCSTAPKRACRTSRGDAAAHAATVCAGRIRVVAHRWPRRATRSRHRGDDRLPLLFRCALLRCHALGFRARPLLAHRANADPVVIPGYRRRERGADATPGTVDRALA